MNYASNKPTSLHSKQGNVYVLGSVLYILAQVASGNYKLISLASGNRLSDQSFPANEIENFENYLKENKIMRLGTGKDLTINNPSYNILFKRG